MGHRSRRAIRDTSCKRTFHLGIEQPSRPLHHARIPGVGRFAGVGVLSCEEYLGTGRTALSILGGGSGDAEVRLPPSYMGGGFDSVGLVNLMKWIAVVQSEGISN